jgi:hypothetical protein
MPSQFPLAGIQLEKREDSMKPLLTACAVLALVFSVAVQAQDPKPTAKVDVTGAWDLSIDTPQGAMAGVATFKQEGEKVTGTQTGQSGEELKLEGTVKDATLAYVLKINMQGNEMAINFTGKVDGDSIAGTFEFGGMGSGAWTAKRKK